MFGTRLRATGVEATRGRKKAAKELTGMTSEEDPGKVATEAVRERLKARNLNVVLGRRRMREELITKKQYIG